MLLRHNGLAKRKSHAYNMRNSCEISYLQRVDPKARIIILGETCIHIRLYIFTKI